MAKKWYYDETQERIEDYVAQGLEWKGDLSRC